MDIAAGVLELDMVAEVVAGKKFEPYDTGLPDGLNTDEDGTLGYIKGGFLHKEDGPAVITTNGDKVYWVDGLPHRLDGPAVERVFGNSEWWINGYCLDCKTQEEFEQLIRLKSFW